MKQSTYDYIHTTIVLIFTDWNTRNNKILSFEATLHDSPAL